MNRGISILAAIATLSILAGCTTKEAPKDADTTPPPEAPKPRQDIVSGFAVAMDGDTVMIEKRNLDLWGIEAPSLSSSDGWFSRAALDRFIGEGGELVCVVKVKRRKRRDQAICSNNKVGDVGRAMLQNGWAVVNRVDKKGQDVDSVLAGVYDRTEKRARDARIGLWTNYPLR